MARYAPAKHRRARTAAGGRAVGGRVARGHSGRVPAGPSRRSPHVSGASRAAGSRTRSTVARKAPIGYPMLLGVVGLINLVGLVMVLSSSSVAAQRAHGDPWYFFERQILWVSIGVVALMVMVSIDYRRLRPLSVPLLLISGGALVAVLVPGVGVSVNGSARWLGVGQWRVQPSELAKLALVVFAADLLTRRADRMNDVRFTFVPVLVTFGAGGLLVMLQPDMGTTMVLFAITLAVVFVAGTPVGALFRALFGGALLALGLGIIEPYRRDRLLSFLHPFKDAGNTGYQIVQSYVGLGSGGLFGRGLGNGVQKSGYLPNTYTDFIFAVIGEETGLVGTIVVVMLFVGFAILGVRAAVRAPDRFGTLLVSGITAWVVVQALLNMGAVIGILPVTGVPLPFVSFGGSSLVIAMGAVGILANVARNGR